MGFRRVAAVAVLVLALAMSALAGMLLSAGSWTSSGGCGDHALVAQDSFLGVPACVYEDVPDGYGGIDRVVWSWDADEGAYTKPDGSGGITGWRFSPATPPATGLVADFFTQPYVGPPSHATGSVVHK